MRFIIQNVQEASVEIVGKNIINSIGRGLLIYVGIGVEDIDSYNIKINKFVNKIGNLKLFSGENGKIDLSLKDISGEVLLISNFTLYGSRKKGSKIDFGKSASFKDANNIYFKLIKSIKESGITVKSGEFGGEMKISSINDGPINYIFEI